MIREAFVVLFTMVGALLFLAGSGVLVYLGIERLWPAIMHVYNNFGSGGLACVALLVGMLSFWVGDLLFGG